MNKWVVKEFMVDHNHPLVEQKNVQFLRSHRVIKNADKAQLNAMRGVGIGTSQIMDYMVQQSGGYNNVGFTKKDLYNHVDVDRRVHLRDGDAEGALAYLCGKSEMDPSFYYKYNVDERQPSSNLFWADSTSKLDYSCFGDVLAFDTTYRTNAYKKPLVILVALNHHHQIIVFGSALLVDESVSTYTWVLETFLDAMNNKKPLSVITDGDKAMRKAIKRIFPDSCHRLCAWHIQRNAFTNVHVKDFTNHFSKCMFMEGTVEEFECAWNDMLEMFNLHGHKWVTDIYAKRSRWAEAYLRGHFFAGMKSTQRALSRIRHNEAKAEFETHHSSAVLTTKLYALEKYAGTVFIRQSFLKFRNEMKNAELFFSVSTENHGGYRVHTLTKFRSPDKIWKLYVLTDVLFSHLNRKKAFKEARCEIQRLTFQMEELCKNSVEESEREDLKATKHHVRDPIIVKTKEFVNTHNAFINIEDSIEDMGDMHSLLNHNMEGGSRHGQMNFLKIQHLAHFRIQKRA
ncbi:Protein FAR1-related sequence 5 [Vitis vinifera]|uniref:Protein FAR1-related sequence 5 n=1 Tax=Vitis vinifera TaxID=29760 RepID=A0A438JCT3_VITVI|nr:Protein FAR1-related sequence 5 [Vitis vinifera]